jgi:hypothetical protein
MVLNRLHTKRINNNNIYDQQHQGEILKSHSARIKNLQEKTRQAAQLERKQLERRLPMPGFMLRDKEWNRITISLYERYRELPRLAGTGQWQFSL